MRLVLTWGPNPSDFDSEVKFFDEYGNVVCRTYYADKTSCVDEYGATYMHLDVDEVNVRITFISNKYIHTLGYLSNIKLHISRVVLMVLKPFQSQMFLLDIQQCTTFMISLNNVEMDTCLLAIQKVKQLFMDQMAQVGFSLLINMITS